MNYCQRFANETRKPNDCTESHCGASDMGNYEYALGAPGKRASLYVRVSTDKQTVENQVARLTEVAKGRGWEIVATFDDAGISGAKERKDRPGLGNSLTPQRQPAN
jgi:hypothetical protein